MCYNKYLYKETSTGNSKWSASCTFVNFKVLYFKIQAFLKFNQKVELFQSKPTCSLSLQVPLRMGMSKPRSSHIMQDLSPSQPRDTG